ncbi:uncharacterized protein C1orf131 homolog isoform X2 [Chiloscyllium plagiosum]|uniref:uncharacterized protein C1orf131 homolog isoform X2 n=1 Tax=Chiloscyllium plagiosum TaxID=36176 RepID=UPI001CB864CD|nr:uncharacterized protein C1orf131 homolog isoform X2 [Chiloscyllium plagiosum]
MAATERLLLDDFLSQLYQCGEAAENEIKNKREKVALKGRKCMQNKMKEQTLCSEDQSVPCSSTLPKTSDSLAKKAASSLCRTPKCLIKLHAELLNSVSNCEKKEKSKEAKIPNSGILTTGEKRPVEVITFTGPHKRKKVPPVMNNDKMEEADEQNNTKQAFNLERPPKREYINYKKYQEMMKDKATAKNMNAKSIFSRGKKEERRSKKSEIVPTGQVGRFKNGALILSDSDIKRIKNGAKSKHV